MSITEKKELLKMEVDSIQNEMVLDGIIEYIKTVSEKSEITLDQDIIDVIFKRHEDVLRRLAQ